LNFLSFDGTQRLFDAGHETEAMARILLKNWALKNCSMTAGLLLLLSLGACSSAPSPANGRSGPSADGGDGRSATTTEKGQPMTSLCSKHSGLRLRPIAMLLFATALVAASAEAHAAGYAVTELEGPGGRPSYATGINNAGQIVGLEIVGGGVYRAVLWNGGLATELAPVGGAFGIASMGLGINNSGQIAGVSFGEFQTRATLWSGTTPTNLGTLEGKGRNSVANDINDAGQVVGYSQTPGEAEAEGHATLWHGTTPIDLGTLGGKNSNARGINNVGQVVGTSEVSLGDSASHAALWSGTARQDLGTLGGRFSYANVINDAGLVIGNSYLAGDKDAHAVLWNGTTLTDLGTLGGRISGATDINNIGQIVGTSTMVGELSSHAVLWEGQNATDLNALIGANALGAGWHLSYAAGINDSGWIVAQALNEHTGQQKSVVLVPVPEPETYALMIAGLGMLWLRSRPRTSGCRLR